MVAYRVGTGSRRLAAGVLTMSAALIASAGVATASTAPSDSWFRDPISRADRAAQVAVPSSPASYRGPLARTTATARTSTGAVAVPATWATGQVLVKPHAVSLTGALFGAGSTRPTSSARAKLDALRMPLSAARAVTCEGYTNYAGVASHLKALSRARAAAVCALIAKANPKIAVTSAGFGGSRPVVIGGTAADRAANRRVVIVVTRSVAPAAPVAPVAVGVFARSNSAVVLFEAPTDDNGLAVIRYEVSVNDGLWRSVTTTGTSPFSAVVSGLANGTTYSLRVRALNAQGASAPSNVVGVTPKADATASAAPVLNLATGADASVVLSFAPPVFDGGTPVTAYEASVDGGAWQTLATAGSVPVTATVGGLVNGTTYTFAVRAVNAVGNSEASNTLVATPITVPPGAPTSLTGDPDPDGHWYFRFDPPASSGSSPIVRYEYQLDGADPWTSLEMNTSGYLGIGCSSTSTSRTVTLSVRAVNATDAGPPTSRTVWRGC